MQFKATLRSQQSLRSTNWCLSFRHRHDLHHLIFERQSFFVHALVLSLIFVGNLYFMRKLFLFSVAAVTVFVFSCSGNNDGTGKTFCDTACNTDSLHFKGNHPLNPMVDIGLNACKADTIMWTHDLAGSKLLDLSADLGQPVTLNPSTVDAYIKDTSYAWLQFNDCKTGRGYLMKLPFNKSEERRKVSGAFTKFDPKFSIEDGLVAYTDRGSVFVENMESGEKAMMPFDKQYDIDFNKLHESVDSVLVTKNRIWVQMIRNGEKKTYEKNISL